MIASVSGSVMVIVVPDPGTEATETWPPSRSTLVRTTSMPTPRPETLVTSREKQVLTRIAMGHANKIIARDLGLSVKTVEKHRSNLMRKLTLHNAAAVTLFALRHGFIEASDKQLQRRSEVAI